MIIRLEKLDTDFVNALLSHPDKRSYSPIVICAKSEESSKYLADKMQSEGMLIFDSIEVSNENAKYLVPIAVTHIEDVENNVVLQKQLIEFFEFFKVTEQVVFLVISKHINAMKISGKLRARLLSGVYVEL